MPPLPLVTQPFGRPDYGLPELQLVNYYVEATPQGPGQFAILPRPALKRKFVIGNGPVRGVFWGSGVSKNAAFFVSGDGFYRKAERIGDVLAGITPARFAASNHQLAVTVGGNAYCFTAATQAFAQITDPDLPKVSDVSYLAGRFYYQEQDKDRWWFSALDDCTSIDGLAFEAAESRPDATIGTVAFGDEAWFFGSQSVEVFGQTGDANAPLAPAPGRSWGHGCASQATIVELDNTLFFVGADRLVYRAASVPERISTHGIEERLRKCKHIDRCYAFPTQLDGHPFYILTIWHQGTFAYDVSTKLWSQFQSFGMDDFRIGCGVYITNGQNGESWLGDRETGQVWGFSTDKRLDHKDPIQHSVSGGAVVMGGMQRCDVVAIHCVRGEGADPAVNAKIEMRYSDNTEVDWSRWKERPLGRKGRVFTIKWTRLGGMTAPGRIFEFRTTDPLTILGATINEFRP